MTNSPVAQKITDNVLAQYQDKITDDRLSELFTALISHLHQFALDVRLTEDEWSVAIDYLTRVGKKCDEQRQEFILLSDVLGLSMIVDAINHDKQGKGTEGTILGPFYVPGAPEVEYGGSIIRTDQPQGEVTLVRGRVLDPDGNPVAGAKLDVWLCAGNALYHMQDPNAPEFNMCGMQTTRDDGSFCFVSEMPVCYSLPTDGPVGELLRATNRHSMRPAHIHLIVSADGHEQLQTHIFSDDDPYFTSDAVFATKDDLVVHFEKCTDSELATQYNLREQFYLLDQDFVILRQ